MVPSVTMANLENSRRRSADLRDEAQPSLGQHADGTAPHPGGLKNTTRQSGQCVRRRPAVSGIDAPLVAAAARLGRNIVREHSLARAGFADAAGPTPRAGRGSSCHRFPIGGIARTGGLIVGFARGILQCRAASPLVASEMPARIADGDLSRQVPVREGVDTA